MKKIICDKCGKKIRKKDAYLLYTSDVFNSAEHYYWCEDCYIEFQKSLAQSEKSFTDVKPAGVDTDILKFNVGRIYTYTKRHKLKYIKLSKGE